MTKDGKPVEAITKKVTLEKEYTMAFMYSFSKEKGSLVFYNEDLARFTGTNWLNDNCMELWIRKMVIDHETSDVYVLPSLFFNKYFQGGKKKDIFDQMTKWIHMDRLETCKYLAIPISGKNHWSLCVIVNPLDVPLRKISLIDSLNNYHDIDMIASIMLV